MKKYEANLLLLYVCLGRVSRFGLRSIFFWVFELNFLSSCKGVGVGWPCEVFDVKINTRTCEFTKKWESVIENTGELEIVFLERDYKSSFLFFYPSGGLFGLFF